MLISAGARRRPSPGRWSCTGVTMIKSAPKHPASVCVRLRAHVWVCTGVAPSRLDCSSVYLCPPTHQSPQHHLSSSEAARQQRQLQKCCVAQQKYTPPRTRPPRKGYFPLCFCFFNLTIRYTGNDFLACNIETSES